jgi:7-keto-8-aminopelargonate synthetase-like enzyme
MIFTALNTPSRTVCTLEQGEMLFFSGTAYLGIPSLDIFHRFIAEGFQKYGANFGGSRTNNVRLKVYQEFEDELADFLNIEACLTMSSGYLIGQLVAQYIASNFSKTQIFYAPKTHPATWINPNLTTPQNDFETWTNFVIHSIEQSKEQYFVIFSNAVDAFIGKVFDFEWITKIPISKKVLFVIDDSHGLGVVGEFGKGVCSYFPKCEHIELLLVSSLGKGLGMPAGLAVGNKNRIEELRKMPFYSGASPVIPAYCYAFLQMKSIYQQQLQKLQKNITYFIEKNQTSFFHFTANYPVFYTPKNELYEYLILRKIILSSFTYYTGGQITRLVINANHSFEDIDKVIEAIHDFEK